MKKLLMIAALPLFFYGCSKSKTNNPVPPTPTLSVSTYAGNGTAGLLDGTGTGAEFTLPSDMAEDASGNLYIADEGNNVIRKIAPGGQVTTFAGDGTAGYKDDAAAKAEFNGPQGLVIDNAGNIYVADSQNNVIRKIGNDGTVSTYAGNGTAGMVNGAAASAEFDHPVGLAVDKSRNLYITDSQNNLIRKITSAGTVSTLAGSGTAGFTNGTGASASFNNPSGITIDGSNNLYVTEAQNGAVREITPAGQVSTFAGGLTSPVRVTVDGASNLYVSCSNNTIQKVSNTGTVSTYAGNGTPGFADGSPLSAEFNEPLGLTANTAGQIVVADGLNNRIRLISSN